MSWQQALERTVTGMGYDLVDIERSAGGLLRVTIDRRPGATYDTGPGEAILVEDCERVTRQLQYLFEVESVDYHRLEVSSPGLDRPLRAPSDWQRFVGEHIEITLHEAFENQKRWHGVLQPGDDDVHWRLLLVPDVPQKPGRKSGPKAKTGRVLRVGQAEPDTDRVMDFSLDEVREARLVPVLDFKGRRNAEPGNEPGATVGVAEKEDGGQD
jgi:ribosome maturation factor RimP